MNSTIKNYYELCKPNVVLMMLICAFVGSLLASKTVAPLSLIAISMLGIGLCASSAAAINQIIDRKADANMSRTENRPIPQGEISPTKASIFAIALGFLGSTILVLYVNTLTAILTLGSLIGYAFIYTIYLKRATPQNIVIGGLAGAAPPLLGWTAVTNSIDPNSLLLVLIIFAWTPPHFWALAIHRKDDYAKENIPMLPVTHSWCPVHETSDHTLYNYYDPCKHIAICSNDVWPFLPYSSISFREYIFVLFFCIIF